MPASCGGKARRYRRIRIDGLSEILIELHACDPVHQSAPCLAPAVYRSAKGTN